MSKKGLQFQTIATLLIILLVIIAVTIVFVTQFGALTTPTGEMSEATETQAETSTEMIGAFCASDAQCGEGLECVDGQCVEEGT